MKKIHLCFLTFILATFLMCSCNIETPSEHDEMVRNELESIDTNISVSIEINCLEVYKDSNLKTSASIPDNGIFLNTTVTLKEGASVYDALSYALSSNGMSFTGGTGYIKSICNLAEKECGSRSGWVYTVNDESSNVSCGMYKLKDGDKIVWFYTR